MPLIQTLYLNMRQCFRTRWLLSDGESGNSLSASQEQLIAEIFGAIEEEYLEDDAVITLSEVDGEDEVAFIEQGYYMALRGNMTHDGSSPVTYSRGHHFVNSSRDGCCRLIG